MAGPDGKKFSDEVIITTDDGSDGNQGLCSDPLRKMLEAGTKVDLVVAIGPIIMMKNVAKTTLPFHVKTTASLSCLMVDGTGMCGGCRVKVGDESKFTCSRWSRIRRPSGWILTT